MSKVFTNAPGNRVSISGQFISKTQKIVLNSALCNNHHYKVRVK